MIRVRETLLPCVQNLQESISFELQGVVNRLLKAKLTLPTPLRDRSGGISSALTAPCYSQLRPEAPCFSNGGASEELITPMGRRKALDESPEADEPEVLLSRRVQRRRWTAATEGIEGALSLFRHAALVPEDIDTPASTVVSDALSDASRASSRRPSLSGDVAKQLHAHFEQSGMPDDDPCSPVSNEDSETPKASGSSTHSSVLWRADALDVGEGMASEALAKKGSASVESIVALVQAERERWDEEKQALEARLEELKAQRRAQQARHRPDAEKEALKRQHQELRKAMKERSRFGAWVCERHMRESDDDEELQKPANSEKEELRRQMGELFQKLRAARSSASGASSEEISPIQRAIKPSLRHSDETFEDISPVRRPRR